MLEKHFALFWDQSHNLDPVKTVMIYKIVAEALWQEARLTGFFLGTADDARDGFIHLSTSAQLRGTLEKHFKGKANLVLLAFEESDFRETLKWEASRGGDLFPHIYGPLPTELAIWCRSLALGADGIPEYDPGWMTC